MRLTLQPLLAYLASFSVWLQCCSLICFLRTLPATPYTSPQQLWTTILSFAGADDALRRYATDRCTVSLDPVRVKCLSSALRHWMSLLRSSPSQTRRAGPGAASGCTTDFATDTSTTTRSSVTTHPSYSTDPVSDEVVRILTPAWTGAPVPPTLSRISPSCCKLRVAGLSSGHASGLGMCGKHGN